MSRRLLRPVVAATMAATVVAATVALGSPGWADDAPPMFPANVTGCVGDSGWPARQYSWAWLRVAPRSVWPISRGAGVTVAIVDTGVSAAAPSLAGAVLPGVDTVHTGRADSDCLGRGTALAGIVASRPMAGSTFAGLAPDATVLPVRVVDERGGTSAVLLANGIRAAAERGAAVILVATGVAGPDPTLRAALDLARARDVLVVAAVAGGSAATSANGGALPVWYPAAYADVIAVGGVSKAGAPTEQSTVAAGVDLAGPGDGAFGIAPVGPGVYTVGGAGVAAAHVAGAAALLRSYEPGLSAAQVRRRLELTAEHPLVASPPLGNGCVDPYAALTAVAPERANVPVRSTARPVTVPVGPAPSNVVRIAEIVAAAAVALVAAGFPLLATLIRRRREVATPPR
jgi:hypothetical protein